MKQNGTDFFFFLLNYNKKPLGFLFVVKLPH